MIAKGKQRAEVRGQDTISLDTDQPQRLFQINSRYIAERHLQSVCTMLEQYKLQVPDIGFDGLTHTHDDREQRCQKFSPILPQTRICDASLSESSPALGISSCHAAGERFSHRFVVSFRKAASTQALLCQYNHGSRIGCLRTANSQVGSPSSQRD